MTISIPDLELDLAQGGRANLLNRIENTEICVVIFTCICCPYAQRYFNPLKGIAAEYADLSFLLVNSSASNEDDDESIEAMRADFENYPIDFFRDETGAVGLALGATTTPEAIVLVAGCDMVYRGPIDDRFDSPDSFSERNEDSPRWPWNPEVQGVESGGLLRKALKATILGSRDAVEIAPIGCSLQYGEN